MARHAPAKIGVEQVGHLYGRNIAQPRLGYPYKNRTGRDGIYAVRRVCLVVLVIVLAACGSNAAPTQVVGSWGPLPTLERSLTAAQHGLRVVWVENGRLFFWHPGETAPRQLVNSGVIQARIAPDGAHIAFATGDESGLPVELSVIDSSGESARVLLAMPYIHQTAWLDPFTLYFNTLEITPLGANPRNDLFRIDIRTDELTDLDYGGEFTFSPDGRSIAITTPGTYGETPGSIRLIDAENGGDPVELLTFPAVATGSHTHFYPAVSWINANTLWTAIPHPDLLYNEGAPEDYPVALWQMDVSGRAEQVGSVAASLYGLPVRSPSTGALVYLRRSPSLNRFELYTADANGANPALVTSGESGTILPPQWLPDGERFIYAQDDAYWIAAPGEDPARRILVRSEMLNQPIVVDNAVVYVTVNPPTGQIELWYAVSGETQSAGEVIAEMGGQIPVLDVMMVE